MTAVKLDPQGYYRRVPLTPERPPNAGKRNAIYRVCIEVI